MIDKIKNLEEQVNSLHIALEESIKLQSHYAKLLNVYDGGLRTIFINAEDWLRRLEFTRTIPLRETVPSKAKEPKNS